MADKKTLSIEEAQRLRGRRDDDRRVLGPLVEQGVLSHGLRTWIEIYFKTMEITLGERAREDASEEEEAAVALTKEYLTNIFPMQRRPATATDTTTTMTTTTTTTATSTTTTAAAVACTDDVAGTTTSQAPSAAPKRGREEEDEEATASQPQKRADLSASLSLEETPVAHSTMSVTTPPEEASTHEDHSSSYRSLPPLTQRQPRTAAAVLAAPPPPKPNTTTTAAPTVPGAVPGTSEHPTSVNATTNAPPTASKRHKQPLIVVDRLDNWTVHFKELAGKLGRPPNGRPYGKGIRFTPKDDDEFRAIQAHLDALGQDRAPYYAVCPVDQRPMKVAIRGLPADTPAEEITQDLTAKGVPVKYTRHIRARTGRPGCIFFAEVEKTNEAVKATYAVNELLHMPGVVVEPWKGKKGPSQCHRCQGFKHSSHNCHRPLACVRCGGPHFATDCTRPRDQPPTCANCGGQHTASNPSCPVYKKEARSRATLAPRTGPARTVHQANMVADSAPATLMAQANNPTAKGAAKRRRRRKNKQAKTQEKTAPAQAPVTTTGEKSQALQTEKEQLAALLTLFAHKVRAGEIDTTGLLQTLPRNA